MSEYKKTDLDRARELGMTIEEFQSLVGIDPLETHSEFTQAGAYVPYQAVKEPKKDKKKDQKAKSDKLCDNFTGMGNDLLPFPTNKDVKNFNATEVEHYWDHPVTSEEDKALLYGYHVHSKDNVFGLHAHYPGGPLGGAHKHGGNNKLGYHTHRYNIEEIKSFKFARPGIMIQIDGPHVHNSIAPDGKHVHAPENYGPAL